MYFDLVVEIIKINLIISCFISLIENLLSTLFSIKDYSNYLKSSEKITLSDNLIKSLYINILKDSFFFRFSFEKNKDPHVFISLFCMFLLWPIHFIGCIIYFSISDLRTLIINEYKILYKKYNINYSLK